jgi:hypothetical protein
VNARTAHFIVATALFSSSLAAQTPIAKRPAVSAIVPVHPAPAAVTNPVQILNPAVTESPTAGRGGISKLVPPTQSPATVQARIPVLPVVPKPQPVHLPPKTQVIPPSVPQPKIAIEPKSAPPPTATNSAAGKSTPAPENQKIKELKPKSPGLKPERSIATKPLEKPTPIATPTSEPEIPEKMTNMTVALRMELPTIRATPVVQAPPEMPATPAAPQSLLPNPKPVLRVLPEADATEPNSPTSQAGVPSIPQIFPPAATNPSQNPVKLPYGADIGSDTEAREIAAEVAAILQKGETPSPIPPPTADESFSPPRPLIKRLPSERWLSEACATLETLPLDERALKFQKILEKYRSMRAAERASMHRR